MNKVTKNVILDLLPLYLAGEVSEDTATLVQKHLEADPELAATAKEMARADSLHKVPIPFSKEKAMETYQEAKKWVTIRILGLATIGAFIFICTSTIVFAAFFAYMMSGR